MRHLNEVLVRFHEIAHWQKLFRPVGLVVCIICSLHDFLPDIGQVDRLYFTRCTRHMPESGNQISTRHIQREPMSTPCCRSTTSVVHLQKRCSVRCTPLTQLKQVYCRCIQPWHTCWTLEFWCYYNCCTTVVHPQYTSLHLSDNLAIFSTPDFDF